MDPTSLGKLEPFSATTAHIKMVVADKSQEAKHPFKFTEFIDAQVSDHKQGDKMVLVLPAGTILDESIRLDWSQPWVNSNKVVAVYCPGDLCVHGDLVNRNINSGPLLAVAGNLQCNNLVSGGARFLICGSLNTSGLVIGEYNDGVLRVGGDVNAEAMINLDHDMGVYGRTNARSAVSDEEDMTQLLVEECFKDDEVCVSRLLERQHAAQPIWKSDKAVSAK